MSRKFKSLLEDSDSDDDRRSMAAYLRGTDGGASTSQPQSRTRGHVVDPGSARLRARQALVATGRDGYGGSVSSLFGRETEQGRPVAPQGPQSATLQPAFESGTAGFRSGRPENSPVQQHSDMSRRGQLAPSSLLATSSLIPTGQQTRQGGAAHGMNRKPYAQSSRLREEVPVSDDILPPFGRESSLSLPGMMTDLVDEDELSISGSEYRGGGHRAYSSRPGAGQYGTPEISPLPLSGMSALSTGIDYPDSLEDSTPTTETHEGYKRRGRTAEAPRITSQLLAQREAEEEGDASGMFAQHGETPSESLSLDNNRLGSTGSLTSPAVGSMPASLSRASSVSSDTTAKPSEVSDLDDYSYPESPGQKLLTIDDLELAGEFQATRSSSGDAALARSDSSLSSVLPLELGGSSTSNSRLLPSRSDQEEKKRSVRAASPIGSPGDSSQQEYSLGTNGSSHGVLSPRGALNEGDSLTDTAISKAVGHDLIMSLDDDSSIASMMSQEEAEGELPSGDQTTRSRSATATEQSESSGSESGHRQYTDDFDSDADQPHMSVSESSDTSTVADTGTDTEQSASSQSEAQDSSCTERYEDEFTGTGPSDVEDISQSSELSQTSVSSVVTGSSRSSKDSTKCRVLSATDSESSKDERSQCRYTSDAFDSESTISLSTSSESDSVRSTQSRQSRQPKQSKSGGQAERTSTHLAAAAITVDKEVQTLVQDYTLRWQPLRCTISAIPPLDHVPVDTDTRPVAQHTVTAAELSTIASRDPLACTLNNMVRQQLASTQRYMEAARLRYHSVTCRQSTASCQCQDIPDQMRHRPCSASDPVVSVAPRPFQYTTLMETQEYIESRLKQNRKQRE